MQHLPVAPLVAVSSASAKVVLFSADTNLGAGHELGHSNPLVTVATAIAGAYAGHKLEDKHEKDKAKKRERRASQGGGYDDYREGRRSRSRSITQRLRRSLSRKRSSSESSSDSDDSRRRRHHRH